MQSLKNLFMDDNIQENYRTIYEEIKSTLLAYRKQAYKAVNSAVVNAYWNIGRIIVEYEQKGKIRAEYGKAVLSNLSEQLTAEFGKGYDERNLRNMRAFYTAFPKWNAVRSELTWTHYRLLLKIENTHARNWYMEEAISSSWSSRQLERQISTLYYERMLASKENALHCQIPMPCEKKLNQNAEELNIEADDNFLRPAALGHFLGKAQNFVCGRHLR